MNFLFVLVVGLLAGTISGIVGTGSSIMLMPVLVYQYGPKQAGPIMAIAAVMANFSRILAWWRDIDWRACAAYSVTGIPAAALVGDAHHVLVHDLRAIAQAGGAGVGALGQVRDDTLLHLGLAGLDLLDFLLHEQAKLAHVMVEIGAAPHAGGHRRADGKNV